MGLRAFAGRDPVIEYQTEAFDTFEQMKGTVKEEFLRYMFHIQMVKQEEQPQLRVVESGPTVDAAGGEPKVAKPEKAASDKVGRNAPCPCGSGKKYKFCHGRE